MRITESIRLFEFLNDSIQSRNNLSDIFTIKNYADWAGNDRLMESIDTKFRINGDSLEVFMPGFECWITFIECDDRKEILGRIIEYGYNRIQSIFKSHNIAYNSLNNIKVNLLEYENYFSPKGNFFSSATGYLNELKVFKIIKHTEETFNRVGKDNIMFSKIETSYEIVHNRYCINDPYLNNFLPEKTEVTNTEYGWVPRSGEKITYYAEIDTGITIHAIEKYVPREHYKSFLEINKILPKEHDSIDLLNVEL
jgi:hypothetical protein